MGIKTWIKNKIEKYTKKSTRNMGLGNHTEENDKHEFLGNLNELVQDNQEIRENISFSKIKEVLEILQSTLKDSKDDLYISGGIVPYIIANEDSERLHDDIDTICNIDDISKLRNILNHTDFYKPEWDSLNVATDGNDYGFEVQINNVPVGIYPFVYENNQLTQYTYDPYTCQCKVKSFELEKMSDYVQSYTSKDGKTYNTMSLEYIKKSKDVVGRPKDIMDSKKIEELGLIREDVMQRIELPTKTNFVNMER